MNTVEFTWNRIILRLSNPLDWPTAQRITGKVNELTPGSYELSLSTQNMQRILRYFDGPNKPVVVGGQQHLDKLREKLRLFKQWRDGVQAVNSQERYPVESNGKFIPYAHQSKIIGIYEKNPLTPVAADCFLPGTLIRLNNIYRPIEEAKIGDNITTLNGEAFAEQLHDRNYCGEIIAIKTNSGFFPLKVTPEHQFYILRRKKCIIKSRGKNTLCSIECSRTCPSKEALKPHQEYKIELVKASDLTVDDCLLFDSTLKDSVNIVPGISSSLLDGYLKIIGYWLAEGWYVKGRKGNRYCLGFGFHKDEEETLVADLIGTAEMMGLRCRIDKSKDSKNVVCLYIHGKEFVNFVHSNFGEYSHDKRVPEWFHHLSNEKKMILIRAAIRGDGTINTNPAEAHNLFRNSENIRYATVSYNLASAFRDAFLSMGIRCSSMTEAPKIDKKGVPHKRCFRILVSRRFMHLFGYEVQKIRKDLRQVFHREGGKRYTLLPIRKITIECYEGKVYNLTSSGHDSYLTDAGVSKNCGTGKTGSTARAIELALSQREITPGKILVSAPLSILETSWMKDIKQFTNLRAAILWTPEGNAKVFGEEKKTITDYGIKPLNAVTVKNKTGIRWVNRFSNQILERITALDGPKANWEQYQIKWKVGITLEGEEISFGPVIGRTQRTEKTREQFIRNQLARTDVDVFLINHDGVRIYEEILKEAEFEWVIVDESTKIKNPQSNVSKAHVDISWKCKRRAILSGTPNPNGFVDLWQQYYFLDRGLTLEPSLKDYLYEYFKPVIVGYVKTPGGKKEAVRYEIRDEERKQALISRLRASGIFIEQRDCIDLPPRVDQIRAVHMTDDQERAYSEMMIELMAELVDRKTNTSVQVDAVNVLSKIMKLRQITSGFLADREENLVKLSDNPKFHDLDDYIEELGGKKLVISCQFQEEIKTLLSRYKDFGAKAIYGGVTDPRVRAEYIQEFQEKDSCRIIILQPKAASHGITLTAAAHLVFLSLDYNFEHYYQVAKRIERIGQKNSMFITHSVARFQDGEPTIDEQLIEILKEKSENRNALFNPTAATEVADRLTSAIIQQVERRK